jgi:uncharacterized protein (DUF885 family)
MDAVDRYLAHRFAFRPVDATFMGASGWDHLLPAADKGAVARELAENRALAAELPAADLHLHDRRLIAAELDLEHARQSLRPRQHNPAWYTSEAGFALISLLLPQSLPLRIDAFAARLAAIPDFLSDGAARLAGTPVPASWAARAIAEATALARFLRREVRLHPAWSDHWSPLADAAASAFETFAAALPALPDANPACGEDHLAFVMQTAHGLAMTPAEAVAGARATYDRLTAELTEDAARLDPAMSWQDHLAALSGIGPTSPEAVAESYRHWDRAALDAAEGLVTPEETYTLDYRPIEPAFAEVAKALYFLFYRSPPGLNPGAGSVYWTFPPGPDLPAFLAANNTATVKTVHAVHHGSVGHHTQNARARATEARLPRIAGTDCAMGIACLGAGTLIEGWACYVEDLLLEAPGFYTPTEALLLKSYERRNAASVLVDINLNTGAWSAAEAASFYRSAGFAPSRVDGEITRNSMFPASRLMYQLGVEGIRDLRAEWKGSTEGFHDRLLASGHVPLAWVAEDMAAEGFGAA